MKGTSPSQANRDLSGLRFTAIKCHDGGVKLFINSLGRENHGYRNRWHRLRQIRTLRSKLERLSTRIRVIGARNTPAVLNAGIWIWHLLELLLDDNLLRLLSLLLFQSPQL